jgi:hypothetical protein
MKDEDRYLFTSRHFQILFIDFGGAEVDGHGCETILCGISGYRITHSCSN